VYAARGTDVRHTVVDGQVLVRDACPVRLDPAEVTADARREAAALLARAGI
jgi:5-methylthioadenosine/S-adenosylhomocysteine deaminase